LPPSSGEALFVETLRARTLPRGALETALSEGRVLGIDECVAPSRAPDGRSLEAGGAVFSLLALPGRDYHENADAPCWASAAADADGRTPAVLASVSVVLSPGGLSVWAPKEEIRGLLALLDENDN
jgi:hypothetical protein